MARTALNGKDTQTDVATQMAALKADIAGLTDAVSTLAKDNVAEQTTKAATIAEAGIAKGKEQAEHVSKVAQDQFANIEDTVRKNPTAAVGVAAGVGFLIGMLSRRRN